MPPGRAAGRIARLPFSFPVSLMPVVRVVPAALLALALAATAARAQSAQRYSLQVSGLHVGAHGEAYEGLKAGPGGEAQFRITPGLWSFGVGVQSSSHSIDDPDFQSESVTLAGVFVEPRRVLDMGSARVAPYLSARLAYLQQSIEFDIDGARGSATASGTQVNGGGGILVRMSPRVNLDLGATYGLINFADAEVEIAGFGRTTIDGSSGSGSNLVLRVGLAIGLR